MFDLDLTPPTLDTITPATTGPTSMDSVDFAVTFSEAVQNFNDTSDVVIVHSGTAHSGLSIAGGPATYTMTVSGITGNGSFTLAADTASDIEDLWRNSLDSSVTSSAVAIDNTAPGITLSSTATPLVTEPITIFAMLTEADTAFTADTVTVINGSVSELTGSGKNFSFTLIPGIDGNFGASVAAAAFTDAAGNNNTASNVLTFTFDGTPPAFIGLTAAPPGTVPGEVATSPSAFPRLSLAIRR